MIPHTYMAIQICTKHTETDNRDGPEQFRLPQKEEGEKTDRDTRTAPTPRYPAPAL